MCYVTAKINVSKKDQLQNVIEGYNLGERRGK